VKSFVFLCFNLTTVDINDSVVAFSLSKISRIELNGTHEIKIK